MADWCNVTFYRCQLKVIPVKKCLGIEHSPLEQVFPFSQTVDYSYNNTEHHHGLCRILAASVRYASCW